MLEVLVTVKIRLWQFFPEDGAMSPGDANNCDVIMPQTKGF
jgi:hypothetical protein